MSTKIDPPLSVEHMRQALMLEYDRIASTGRGYRGDDFKLTLDALISSVQRDLIAQVQQMIEMVPLPIHEDSTYYRVGYLAALENVRLNVIEKLTAIHSPSNIAEGLKPMTKIEEPDIAYITPSVLSWALDGAVLSRPYIEGRMGLVVGALECWERGDGHPTFDNLQTLADLVDVPLGCFFLPGPPDWDTQRDRNLASSPQPVAEKLASLAPEETP